MQSGNINFAGIASLRPLFMFFKPDCYLFEVYFMVEKLLMIGIVRMMKVYLGGFFLARSDQPTPPTGTANCHGQLTRPTDAAN